MKNRFLQTSFIFFLIAVSNVNAQTNTFPSSGKVGIGTTSPNASSLLEIKSTTKGLLIPRMSSTERNNIVSPANGLMVYDNTMNSFFYYNGTKWITISKGLNEWEVNGSNILNKNTGNVTIGTGTSDYKLNIFSSKIESNNNTDLLKLGGRNPFIGLYDENNIGYGYIKAWTNAPYAPFTKGLVVGSSPGDAIFLSTNYGATMTIANTNKVGIGTTTPEYWLEVKSTTVESNNNTNLVKLTGRNPVLVMCDENSNPYGYIKAWTNAPYAPFTNGMLIGSTPGYPIFLSTNYGLAMIIANNGNVGIGTAAPNYKLSVNGTIQAKEVRVETGWSDYVFEKNYKLRSLNNVASYVEKYKHLPGIPSAKEIKTNGLPVAEMETKMMAKIEELTRYIIDLQKQIDELKAERK